jgi:hypothetical protein
MVVASLPFPPLPVVVLQGEDGADGLASSFDLLQTAVMNAQLGLGPADRDAEELARSKQATLERLQQDMAALHQSVAAEASAASTGSRVAWVQRAYEIYCAAFRTYFLEHYGTSSRDLRFYPLAAVAPDSLLVRQGSSHWNAGRLSYALRPLRGRPLRQLHRAAPRVRARPRDASESGRKGARRSEKAKVPEEGGLTRSSRVKNL